MSTMRKRKAVTLCPVLLVNLRRMVKVPSAQFGPPHAFGAELRSRLGAAVEPACGSMSAALICALRWIGLVLFSGPGAPSVELTPPNTPPVVEMNTKSAALSPVSWGNPVASLRTKLYSPPVVPTGTKPFPSR